MEQRILHPLCSLGVIASFWAFSTDDGLAPASQAGSGLCVIGVIVRPSLASFWHKKIDDGLQSASQAGLRARVIGVILGPMTRPSAMGRGLAGELDRSYFSWYISDYPKTETADRQEREGALLYLLMEIQERAFS